MDLPVRWLRPISARLPRVPARERGLRRTPRAVCGQPLTLPFRAVP